MTRHAKTAALISTAREILEAYHPMTVRQVYYQLVSRQVIDNNRGAYQTVSNALVGARQEGLIPWAWIEDRLRRPRVVGMWDDLADFAETAVKAYRRDVWATQPSYLEVWVEKDALSGLFEDVLEPYGVTLNVGRGYDGWSSIYNAAGRFVEQETARDGDRSFDFNPDESTTDFLGKVVGMFSNTHPGTILYYGDLDPSGEDIARSLRARLAELGCTPHVEKRALTAQDVKDYNLPPDFTKASDTRRNGFVEKFGDIAVELDALPADVLQTRLRNDVENLLDLEALAETKRQEEAERETIKAALA